MGFQRYDRLRYGHDFLLFKVTEYVIATKRQTMLWMQILYDLSQSDPRVLFYLTELYLSLDKVKEAMTLLAEALT